LTIGILLGDAEADQHAHHHRIEYRRRHQPEHHVGQAEGDEREHQQQARHRGRLGTDDAVRRGPFEHGDEVEQRAEVDQQQAGEIEHAAGGEEIQRVVVAAAEFQRGPALDAPLRRQVEQRLRELVAAHAQQRVIGEHQPRRLPQLEADADRGGGVAEREIARQFLAGQRHALGHAGGGKGEGPGQQQHGQRRAVHHQPSADRPAVAHQRQRDEQQRHPAAARTGQQRGEQAAAQRQQRQQEQARTAVMRGRAEGHQAQRERHVAE
jgi:hypothetical protein